MTILDKRMFDYFEIFSSMFLFKTCLRVIMYVIWMVEEFPVLCSDLVRLNGIPCFDGFSVLYYIPI